VATAFARRGVLPVRGALATNALRWAFVYDSAACLLVAACAAERALAQRTVVTPIPAFIAFASRSAGEKAEHGWRRWRGRNCWNAAAGGGFLTGAALGVL